MSKPRLVVQLQCKLAQHSCHEDEQRFLDEPNGEHEPCGTEKRHAGEFGEADREDAYHPKRKDVGGAQQQGALADGVKVADRRR